MSSAKRIAVVYDWFDSWGGVERVLQTIHRQIPEATFFTSYVDPKKAQWARGFHTKSSFIQRLPSFVKHDRVWSLPFYPYAFESFRFHEYDVVLSITSSFAKGIITHPGILHVCYLLTPTRYLWISPHEYQSRMSRTLGKGFIRYLKEWDQIASTRPDAIVSISQTVAERCLTYYHRKSSVLYPPFDRAYWMSQPDEKPLFSSPYYLLVSRLEKYKHIELAIDVFNKRNDTKLIIVGTGKEKKSLQKKAGESIRFLDGLSDSQLAALYRNAEALVMPQEEDFGYVALEAQTLGCPVIAYGKGGATETVRDGKTGIFFTQQSPDGLMSALERFHTISYNLKADTKKNGPADVVRFSSDRFIEGLNRVLYKDNN